MEYPSCPVSKSPPYLLSFTSKREYSNGGGRVCFAIFLSCLLNKVTSTYREAQQPYSAANHLVLSLMHCCYDVQSTTHNYFIAIHNLLIKGHNILRSNGRFSIADKRIKRLVGLVLIRSARDKGRFSTCRATKGC